MPFKVERKIARDNQRFWPLSLNNDGFLFSLPSRPVAVFPDQESAMEKIDQTLDKIYSDPSWNILRESEYRIVEVA